MSEVRVGLRRVAWAAQGLCEGLLLSVAGPSQTGRVWDSRFPTTHSSRPRLPMKISCLQVLHGLFMKAAELSPWELIGCSVFSILMTYADGVQVRDPPGSSISGGTSFSICRTCCVLFLPRQTQE